MSQQRKSQAPAPLRVASNVDEERQHLFKVLGFKMGGKLNAGIVTIEELKDLMAERVMISARRYAPDLVPILEEEMRKIP